MDWYGIPTSFVADAKWEAVTCHPIVDDCSGISCRRCAFFGKTQLWKQLALIEPLKSLIVANKLAQGSKKR